MAEPRDYMELAIAEARECEPSDPKRIPRVGAVIVADGKIIGKGHRGPEEHAEKVALSKVKDPNALVRATVYTTLEPCTGDVRSKPLEACTELLTQSKVKEVFIGILDPNQAVCGKGVIRLQKHKIKVALFDADLADEILQLNDVFVRAQQSLGVALVNFDASQELETYKTGGWHTFRCNTVTEPGPDVFVLTQIGGTWWPQFGGLRQTDVPNEYEFRINFGAHRPHKVHIIRANELGAALMTYYGTVTADNQRYRERIKDRFELCKDDPILKGGYPGVEMSKLPRGLDLQFSFEVKIAPKP
jgi:pyrimidine deaminase RibD-like protein